MAGQVSVEDRSRRMETVSPQHDEHYGCQSERDRASSENMMGMTSS